MRRCGALWVVVTILAGWGCGRSMPASDSNGPEIPPWTDEYSDGDRGHPESMTDVGRPGCASHSSSAPLTCDATVSASREARPDACRTVRLVWTSGSSRTADAETLCNAAVLSRGALLTAAHCRDDVVRRLMPASGDLGDAAWPNVVATGGYLGKATVQVRTLADGPRASDLLLLQMTPEVPTVPEAHVEIGDLRRGDAFVGYHHPGVAELYRLSGVAETQRSWKLRYVCTAGTLTRDGSSGAPLWSPAGQLVGVHRGYDALDQRGFLTALTKAYDSGLFPQLAEFVHDGR